MDRAPASVIIKARELTEQIDIVDEDDYTVVYESFHGHNAFKQATKWFSENTEVYEQLARRTK